VNSLPRKNYMKPNIQRITKQMLYIFCGAIYLFLNLQNNFSRKVSEMKTLFILCAVLSLSIIQAAQADELLCASEKNQILYYTTGQVRLTAEINNTTRLSRVSLSISGSEKYGVSQAEVKGKIQGNYVRFEIGGDAWCSYKLTLPKGFMTRESTPAFIDAYCEESTKSSVRLNCAIQ